MKKNNKGFFLAETIVVIALVTTVMAFVYPNISNLYNNYNNRTKYYDQPEDLYALRALNDYFLSLLGTSNDPYNSYTNNGCKIFIAGNITSSNSASDEILERYNNDIKPTVDMKIDKLYITGYMTNLSSNNYNFNRYLKRLKKTTYDSSSYRIIGVFKDGDVTRYASIKLDNPNPNRNCNLGG